MNNINKSELLKEQILELVKEYYELAHSDKVFEPGKTKVNYAGRVYDEKELQNLVASSLDFWLTAGPYAAKFERKMSRVFESKDFYLVNSGSSANLVMVSALCSQRFKNRLKPGDEVITPAVTFPTTLTPILQNQLVPVFVDCEIGTYNINPKQIEDAIGPKTRVIFIPHTLGNPCDMDIIMDVAQRKKLIVLEDNCDSLGSEFNGKLTGTFGAMASLSFYPAHHMTMGEGGGVVINDEAFSKIALSIRDWGRDCYCLPGRDNSCGCRFDGQFGKLPAGYDHKYVYSDIGYNLKVTDMQAAIGLAQFDKVEQFTEARRRNFNLLYDGLKKFEEYLILPKIDSRANPSPFAFPITVRNGIDRQKLIQHLENAKIETRLPFAGNILCQPGFMNIPHRIYNNLDFSNVIMSDTFFIGVYPGLKSDIIDFIIESFFTFWNDEGVK